MNTTSASLLERLRQPASAAADWGRFLDIYLPLLRSWLARTPGLGDEVEDVAQDVLVIVFRELNEFQRRRQGSFRAWLRIVTANRVRTWRRTRLRQPATGLDSTDEYLSQLEDPNSQLSHKWDREHDRHVFEKLLAAIKPDFEQSTWEAFRLFAVEGGMASVVAEDLGTSENAVLLAKSRIVKRLREESAGLLD